MGKNPVFNENLYLDVHVLQTIPPSCVNRDDTGAPKTAIFGGTTRARVSSSAWKRAVRTEFTKIYPSEALAVRTKNANLLIAEKIMEQSPDTDMETALRLADEAMKCANIKSDDTKNTLFFIGYLQAEKVAELALKFHLEDMQKPESEKTDDEAEDKKDETDGKKDKKKGTKSSVDRERKNAYLQALKDTPGIDAIMFGRMSASEPSLNYDACVQVAHAISTHTVENQYDFFTALDDYQDETKTGAAHLDVAEFNSATLYRYANVNVGDLTNYFDTDTAIECAVNFVKAFVLSMPTGKQNSFANRTIPELVYVTLRHDQPVNLVNAFEKPVFASGGYSDKSCQALAEYADTLYDTWPDLRPDVAWAVKRGSESDVDATLMPDCIGVTFTDLLESIKTAIKDAANS